ncbi:GntR family transcriptional regulator [Tistrella bauzanensis]|uniref:GntR family transcriptional regulator n=1 Tax=Tistrella bauzanensis TaxID=657419 RepID=A0ABQ1J2N7_9PROT|nr:PLP-dependent aminotransferase family protein [Tistrella bauzanensis]GGB58624.1 GntR family transcriptional regulator [Tistrella bauzanensis]
MLNLVRDPGTTIQASLRQAVVQAIAEGRLATGQKLPPSRRWATQLGIARNTVTAVLDDLVARGYLVSAERRGYFVAGHPGAEGDPLPPPPPPPVPAAAADTHDTGDADAPAVDQDPAAGPVWIQRFTMQPGRLRNIEKPRDWQRYPYPFIYGQVDQDLFPIAVWRQCSRDALGRSAVNYWAADQIVDDDPLLIEQIRRHILPARGIYARADEILITLGSQHGLYLLSRLLVRPADVVGIEDPGYPDARNIFALAEGSVRLLPVDDGGIDPDGTALDGVTLAVVTPSYHCPTMVTMPQPSQRALLARAIRDDMLLIEDDYEGETRFEADARSLKSMDRTGRVIYLGSLSKVLAPGVRLGFMVGAAPLIAEARALRRLMHRTAPLNNQRTAAIFLAEGHYQGLVRTLRVSMKQRWDVATRAVDLHIPDVVRPPSTGGSSIWLRLPDGLAETGLGDAARRRGVLFESGQAFFAAPPPGHDHIRLGLSSIGPDRIGEGVQRLAAALAEAQRAARPGQGS